MPNVSEAILRDGDGGSRSAHSGPAGSEAGRSLLDLRDAALAARAQVGKPTLLDRLEEARWAINSLVERYDDIPNPIAPSHFAWDLLDELDAVCKDVVRLRNDLIGGMD